MLKPTNARETWVHLY